MSRSKNSWFPPPIAPGWVYTLHLDPPLPEVPGPGGQQAKHYTGFAEQGRLAARLGEHAAGRGAKLTTHQVEAGGTWTLGRLEPGTTADENKAKYHGASRRCDVCWREGQAARREPEAEPEAEAG